MKKSFFTLASLMLSFSGFAQNVDKLVDHYLAVKDALVRSDSKSASAAIASFRQGIEAESSFPQKKALLEATGNMAKANSIEKQRAGFNEVSVITWKIVEQSSKNAQPLYYQYCPMKKTYWLSKEKEIRNPYYGASMLTCGKVAETKN